MGRDIWIARKRGQLCFRRELSARCKIAKVCDAVTGDLAGSDTYPKQMHGKNGRSSCLHLYAKLPAAQSKEHPQNANH